CLDGLSNTGGKRCIPVGRFVMVGRSGPIARRRGTETGGHRKEGAMARIGLREVASRAGVSIKTVSNVVNGTGSVTTATRERVEEALAALDYRPNLAARHLRRGSSG